MSGNLRPYPEYKDSGVPWLGRIPSHWNLRRAKYLYREVDERSQTGEEELCSVSHKTGVTPRKANVTMFMAETTVGYKIIRPNDLVINTLWAWMAALGIARQVGVVSPAYGVYRPLPSSELAPDFADKLLRTEEYKAEYIARSTGINASRLRLYPDQFLRIPILLPPYEEQIAIARYLDGVDNRIRRFIRNRRRLIEVLNEQKQAIINRAVTRGLDPNARLKPSGIDWLGEIPEHWEVWRIGHFARVGNGSTPSRGNAAYWQDGDSPWLNSSAVNRGIIEEADQFVTTLALRECHLPIVEPGSLLVAITGQGKTRGTAAILSIRATINQHLAYITPHNRKLTVLPEYLNAFFAAAYPELRRMSDDSGSTKGALTCSDLRHFQVAIPPEQEQKAIVARINIDTRAIEATLRTTLREIELIGEYRTRLIADVVTGKVDVRGLAPAESPIDDELLDEGFDDEEMLADDESELVGEAAAED